MYHYPHRNDIKVCMVKNWGKWGIYNTYVVDTYTYKSKTRPKVWGSAGAEVGRTILDA